MYSTTIKLQAYEREKGKDDWQNPKPGFFSTFQ